jgi:superfamily I DNA/RNA helicase
METPTDVDYVRIMSLHKSKGLTARVVIVMGCVEGFIPRDEFDAVQAERQRILEEQRRLFYVALTRTTETLVLSSVTFIPMNQALAMGLGVGGGQVQTSRFINELGPTRPNPIAGAALLT